MHAQPLLRWVLRHGHDALTCQVHALAPHAFDVSVVPHWNQASAVTERFESANEAVRRHAEIVGLLREGGWSSTEYRRGRSTGIGAA
jgi:hypothetical protein